MSDLILSNPIAYGGDDEDVRLTPRWLFDKLDAEFRFTLDAAANETNHLCRVWLGPGSFRGEDALSDHEDVFGAWSMARAVWCNPPFSQMAAFAARAFAASMFGGTVVMLMPGNRHEQAWFHEYVLDGAAELRFPCGRVAYGGTGKSPEWPSLVVVWRPRHTGPPISRAL